MVPIQSLLQIFRLVESSAACRLGGFPGTMDVAEILLEFGPVLVGGCFVVPLRAGLVKLLGVGDKLE